MVAEPRGAAFVSEAEGRREEEEEQDRSAARGSRHVPRGGCRWLSLGLGQLSGGSWVTVTPALKCSACTVPNPRSAAGRHRRLIHFMDEGTDGERASSYGEVTESGSS